MGRIRQDEKVASDKDGFVGLRIGNCENGIEVTKTTKEGLDRSVFKLNREGLRKLIIELVRFL